MTKGFEIGSFWVFVLSAFGAFVSTCSVYISGYYAAVGYSVSPGIHIEKIETVELLSQIQFLKVVILWCFILTVLILIAPYIQEKLKISINKSNVYYRIAKYFDVVGITAIWFWSLYKLALLFTISYVGSEYLRVQALNALDPSSYAATCINLQSVIPVVTPAIVFFYLTVMWLCGLDYFLKDEQEWLFEKLKVLYYYCKRLIVC